MNYKKWLKRLEEVKENDDYLFEDNEDDGEEKDDIDDIGDFLDELEDDLTSEASDEVDND